MKNVSLLSQGERNLENVTHEEAVATLKSITDKVTLVVGKTNLSTTNNSNNLSNASNNSHSTSAVNNVGHSVVDFGRSQSPAPPSLSRSHSPRKLTNFLHYISLYLTHVSCLHRFGFIVAICVIKCVGRCTTRNTESR